jgi:hypothetical protein
VLALRPAVVGHIHLPDSASASRRAEAAFLHALGHIPVVHEEVGGTNPMLATREAVRRLVHEFQTVHACDRVIVHVTGSTKLLAIGAYEAAREMGLECIYLELPHDDDDGVPQVVSLGTGTLDSEAVATLSSDPSERMTIELVARAHGYELVTAGEDFAPFLSFARAALHDEDAEECLQTSLPAVGGDRAPWPDEPLWLQ